MGAVDLERKLGVPREHLEFPFWYMKKRGWVEILQSGQYAITIDGIEEVLTREATAPVHRMLTEGEDADLGTTEADAANG